MLHNAFLRLRHTHADSDIFYITHIMTPLMKKERAQYQVCLVVIGVPKCASRKRIIEKLGLESVKERSSLLKMLFFCKRLSSWLSYSQSLKTISKTFSSLITEGTRITEMTLLETWKLLMFLKTLFLPTLTRSSKIMRLCRNQLFVSLGKTIGRFLHKTLHWVDLG